MVAVSTNEKNSDTPTTILFDSGNVEKITKSNVPAIIQVMVPVINRSIEKRTISCTNRKPIFTSTPVKKAVSR